MGSAFDESLADEQALSLVRVRHFRCTSRRRQANHRNLVPKEVP
jgi:hypothetical protein